MVLTGSRRLTRMLILLVAIAAVLLLTKPAHADTTDQTIESLQRWARMDALPRLARATAEEAADAPAQQRSFARSLATLPVTAGVDPARLTDRNRSYWQTAAADTAGALRLKIVVHLAAGDIAGVQQYLQLAGNEASQDPWLAPIAASLPVSPLDAEELLGVADAALDRGDYAFAAHAYRLVAHRLQPADYNNRDVNGHYLYCLNKLGVEPPMLDARAKFYQSVVYPQVEALSRERQLLRGSRASLSAAYSD